jgi:hypothetical protein
MLAVYNILPLLGAEEQEPLVVTQDKGRARTETRWVCSTRPDKGVDGGGGTPFITVVTRSISET